MTRYQLNIFVEACLWSLGVICVLLLVKFLWDLKWAGKEQDKEGRE